MASAGGLAELTCRPSAPAALAWWHDGALLPAAGARLVLRGVTRAHAGMYQCEATLGARTALAAAELRLAGTRGSEESTDTAADSRWTRHHLYMLM